MVTINYGEITKTSGVYERTPIPGQFRLSGTAYLVAEGTKAKVTVQRINGADGIATISYITKPKTALAWQDYIPKSGTLTWTNGQTASKTIKINILSDGKTEGNEVFQIVLKTPVGATLATPFKANITILSNSKNAQASDAATQSSRMARLTEALDGEGLTWFTSTLSPWTKESFVTVDKVAAAISGQSDLDRVSWLQTELEGPGTLEYDWLVKGMGLDACLLIVDGKVYRTLGPGHAWMHETIPLEEGSHTIRWAVTGESRLIPGSAYLDQVKWVPEENFQLSTGLPGR